MKRVCSWISARLAAKVEDEPAEKTKTTRGRWRMITHRWNTSGRSRRSSGWETHEAGRGSETRGEFNTKIKQEAELREQEKNRKHDLSVMRHWGHWFKRHFRAGDSQVKCKFLPRRVRRSRTRPADVMEKEKKRCCAPPSSRTSCRGIWTTSVIHPARLTLCSVCVCVCVWPGFCLLTHLSAISSSAHSLLTRVLLPLFSRLLSLPPR